MPIDLNDFRKYAGGNPDKIRESERRRFNDVKKVDRIIELDDKWRKLRGENDILRKEKRKLGNQVRDLMKAGKKEEALKIRATLKDKNKEYDAKIKAQEIVMKESAAERDELLSTIGNYLHSTVPDGEDEDKCNRVERTWGLENRRGAVDKSPGGGKGGALLHHHELLSRIDGYEPERGVRVAGHRAYFLKGPGVALNFALQNYAQAFLAERKYTLLQTPYFMDKQKMGQVAELADYDETLYYIATGNPVEDKYLIATSEQPICLYHADEWLPEKELKENPKFYGGISTCFRKEAGKTGVDNWGIFRVHQFEKIEQFCVCHPEDSWKMHDRMIAQAEEFTKSLGLPYQVIAICAGELNNAAAKKYDLEAWFPGYVEIDKTKEKPHPGMRELVSCSNCLDYQARAVEIRCGYPPSKAEKRTAEKKYAHMLNATLCATTRVICCILENFQTPEGVLIPEVLIPFMNKAFVSDDSKGRKIIKYTQEVRINPNAARARAGEKKSKKGKKGGKGAGKGGGKAAAKGGKGKGGGEGGKTSPEDVLLQKLYNVAARGEISKKEYDLLKAALGRAGERL